MKNEKLESDLKEAKANNLKLLKHSQELGEHLYVLMLTLLEVTRQSKDTYSKHAQFVRQMIEQQKGLNDEHEDPTTKI